MVPLGPTTTTIPGSPDEFVDRPPADAGIYGDPADGTGSGGGCASGGSQGTDSGKGGSGICIISYPS